MFFNCQKSDRYHVRFNIVFAFAGEHAILYGVGRLFYDVIFVNGTFYYVPTDWRL